VERKKKKENNSNKRKKKVVAFVRGCAGSGPFHRRVYHSLACVLRRFLKRTGEQGREGGEKHAGDPQTDTRSDITPSFLSSF
jgi:hypothetical protein